MRHVVYGRPAGTLLSVKTKVSIIRACYAYNAEHRELGQHQGPITRVMFDVLRVLLYDFHNSKSGDCFPGYDRIAVAARCCRDSVRRAINKLEEAGILTWDRCFVKRRVPPQMRWKVLRTSNAYVFAKPPEPDKMLKAENRSGTCNPEHYSTWRPPEKDLEAYRRALLRLEQTGRDRFGVR